jgi:hypothetical protein
MSGAIQPGSQVVWASLTIGLMLIASLIERNQRFIALFAQVSRQSLGRDQGQKSIMLS